jgi:hypothetical protein
MDEQKVLAVSADFDLEVREQSLLLFARHKARWRRPRIIKTAIEAVLLLAMFLFYRLVLYVDPALEPSRTLRTLGFVVEFLFILCLGFIILHVIMFWLKKMALKTMQKQSEGTVAKICFYENHLTYESTRQFVEQTNTEIYELYTSAYETDIGFYFVENKTIRYAIAKRYMDSQQIEFLHSFLVQRFGIRYKQMK